MERTASPGIFKQPLKGGGHSYVVVVQGPDRKQVRRSVPTLAAAKERQATLKSELASGETIGLDRTTFADYAASWIENYRGRDHHGISETTRENYRSGIKRAVAYFGKTKLASIRPQQIRAYAKHLEDAGLSAGTRRTAMIPVKAIFATALEDQLIRSNPARAVKLSARSANADDEDANAKALTEEQLALFIESTPADHRLMIELMSDTGLRIGETLGLKWKDIDFGKERLTVRRQVSRKRFAPPKSKNGKRTIRLTHSMAQALWPLRGADDAPVFGDAGQHLDHHRAKEAILPAVRKATGLGWVNFHTLRHTLATRLFRNGANVKQVQVWLGHNSPGFTLETYVHLLPEDLPDVAFLEVARAERPALAAKAAQESAEPLRTAALG